jgi:hypothetical protein
MCLASTPYDVDLVTYEIRLDGSPAPELTRGLLRWLAADPVLRRAGTTRLASAPASSGELGAATEWIEFLASSVIDLSALVVAVAAWRDTREPKLSVTIKRGNVTVTVNTNDPDDLARIAELLSGEDDD